MFNLGVKSSSMTTFLLFKLKLIPGSRECKNSIPLAIPIAKFNIILKLYSKSRLLFWCKIENKEP